MYSALHTGVHSMAQESRVGPSMTVLSIAKQNITVPDHKPVTVDEIYGPPQPQGEV
jgi:hypothetical protein